MSQHLVLGGWSGRRKIPVCIVGETPDGFAIVALERVFLPGHGMLKKGQLSFVPRGVIQIEAAGSRADAATPSNDWAD
ncbi:MAG: hypothetical protein ACLPPF_17040 [Rhodomicrobium sp.]